MIKELLAGISVIVLNEFILAQNITDTKHQKQSVSFDKMDARIDSLENALTAISANSGRVVSTIEELKRIVDESKPVQKVVQSPAPVISPIKIGFLGQMQAQAVQEQTTAMQDSTPGFTRHWQRQMFIRRSRVILGSDVAKNTSFFFESDATNIGKVSTAGTKDVKVSMYVQDAYIQHVVAPEFSVIAGLQLVGTTRNSLQSAASLMALNYGSYQFVPNTPLDNNVGRDIGVNFRGFLLNERLEYRAGVFSGKNFNQYSPLRTIVRLNYMFEDREKGFFYSGTTLGKGRLLSVGAGIDAQSSYYAWSADAIIDLPVFELGSLTTSMSLTFLNGGGSSTDSTFYTGSIPRQIVFFGELGFFFKEFGLQPYMKYESQLVNAIVRQVGATTATLNLQNSLRTESRYGLGINYFINGHNANLKVLYEIVLRNRLSLNAEKAEEVSKGEFTAQLQYYIF